VAVRAAGAGGTAKDRPAPVLPPARPDGPGGRGRPGKIVTGIFNPAVTVGLFAGVALFQGGWAVHQLWLFWVMPLLGGAAGGLTYRLLLEERGASR